MMERLPPRRGSSRRSQRQNQKPSVVFLSIWLGFSFSSLLSCAGSPPVAAGTAPDPVASASSAKNQSQSALPSPAPIGVVPVVEPPVSLLDPVSVSGLQVSLSAREVPDGGVVWVQIKSAGGGSELPSKAVFQGHTFYFFPAGEGQVAALVGVPYDLKVGEYPLTIHSGEGASTKMVAVPIRVRAGAYVIDQLQIAPRIAEPNKKDLVRIVKEQAETGKIYEKVVRTKMWDGQFHFPVQSVITSRYGNKRVFNGKTQSFHRGLDLRAPTGTPITAPANGEVVLAKNLFFTGNTVILSHGYGVFTIYAHMSKLKVKKGMHVTSTRVIGLSGATGRAAGPHLHWGVILSHVTVDPIELIKVVR